MNIRVKRLHPDAVIPKYAKLGDSGFDLTATEDVIIAPGETSLVPTGLAFEIPENYELQIRPRSGVSYRTKLRVANTPGTVDSSYRGEVKVIIDNISQAPALVSRKVKEITGEILPSEDRELRRFDTYLIRKGDRIAQGIIAPVIRANLIETDGELTETERGDGGFGHSGVTAEEAVENMRKAFEVLPSTMDEETRTFECVGCFEWVTGEVGTRAEDAEMCASCYCAYQGG